jgi:hypothetical protein
VDSNQLILTTAVQAGLLALGLALFGVGGAWLWAPLAPLALGVLLAGQMRVSFVAAAVTAALFLWSAAALLDGWSGARIAWIAAPLFYPLAALLGAVLSRLFSRRASPS